MKRINYLLFFLAAVAVFASCEPNNPFATGPVYDFDGNLALDSVKIEAYLDTAQIDSLYRIHDSNTGIVVIVQEEGLGSRPVSGTVVYTNYTGSLITDGSVFDTSLEQVARDNSIYVDGRSYNPLQFTLGAEARHQLLVTELQRLNRGLGDAWELSPDFKQKYLKGAGELELVRSGLDDTMRTAYQSMREVWHSRKDVTDLRTAAYLVSIAKVAASYRAMGL